MPWNQASKCDISHWLTQRSGRTDGRTILSEAKFLGYIDQKPMSKVLLF